LKNVLVLIVKKDSHLCLYMRKEICYNQHRANVLYFWRTSLLRGGVAQLGERTVRIRKVESSILFVSTTIDPPQRIEKPWHTVMWAKAFSFLDIKHLVKYNILHG
jgi:hypothetical protein